MRKKNSFLLVLTCVMATLMMAGRCSDDDDKPATSEKVEKAGDAPVSALPDDDTLKSNAESGVEKDPLGDAPMGDDGAVAPLEDGPTPGGDDSQMLDDPSFEPEQVPDEATDL